MKNVKNPEKIRYSRVAVIYDLMEFLPEILRIRKWRQKQLSRLNGGLTLEVGMGTGKNLQYYPQDVPIIGIDISEKMIRIAKRKDDSNRGVKMLVMNAEELGFKDGQFDNIVSTFVFCSVSDPVVGLRELKRVLKSDGQALFLEHVRPGSRLLGKIFDIFNPLVVRIWGANINRNTVENIKQAGFQILSEENLSKDIVKLIVAR